MMNPAEASYTARLKGARRWVQRHPRQRPHFTNSLRALRRNKWFWADYRDSRPWLAGLQGSTAPADVTRQNS